MSRKFTTCPDCAAAVGTMHLIGCDVERCPHCGMQALSCSEFDPKDSRRQPWDGTWPGDSDCQRLGFETEDGYPDLNRLVMECRWDSDKQQWER